MNRITHALLRVGLLIALVGAIGQLVLMVLDIFIIPDLRWYWGGALAYFAAPVAFAVTLKLLGDDPAQGRTDA